MHIMPHVDSNNKQVLFYNFSLQTNRFSDYAPLFLLSFPHFPTDFPDSPFGALNLVLRVSIHRSACGSIWCFIKMFNFRLLHLKQSHASSVTVATNSPTCRLVDVVYYSILVSQWMNDWRFGNGQLLARDNCSRKSNT